MTSHTKTSQSVSTSTNDASSVPWVERYRPKSLEDVSHQSEVVATLQNAVQTGRLPHLLLYGPPGSGKTSVALALCRQLWHPSQWRRRVLELNASDERGISVVRDKIKHFASLSVGGESGNSNNNKRKPQPAATKSGGVGSFFQTKKKSTSTSTSNNNANMEVDLDDKDKENIINEQTEEEESYPNPPFKIIILDEADTVTPDAQAALRRIIEAHSRITRFILICNYVTRIIEPLASRCAKFRFQALPAASMKERLRFIAQSEGCDVSDQQLSTVLNLAEGDMRRAVTTLQSVQALMVGMKEHEDDNNDVNMLSSQTRDTVVDETVLSELAGLPPPAVLQQLVKAMKSKLFDTVQEAVREVCASGYSAQFVLQGLLQQWVLAAAPPAPEGSTATHDLSELSKAKLAIRMAEAEAHMMDGADEYLQLMTVCGLGMECLVQQGSPASNSNNTNERTSPPEQ